MTTPLKIVLLLLVLAGAYLVFQYVHIDDLGALEPKCGVVKSDSGLIELEGFQFSMSDAWQHTDQPTCQELATARDVMVKALTISDGNTDEWIAKSYISFWHTDGHLVAGFLLPSESNLDVYLEAAKKNTTGTEQIGMEMTSLSIREFDGARCVVQMNENPTLALRSLTCKRTDASPGALLVNIFSPQHSSKTPVDLVINSLTGVSTES